MVGSVSDDRAAAPDRAHLAARMCKTLNYEATIDDPGAYTAPWSLQVDDHRDLEVPVDSRRRDLRVHLPGR